jgi:hypothetical protein
LNVKIIEDLITENGAETTEVSERPKVNLKRNCGSSQQLKSVSAVLKSGSDYGSVGQNGQYRRAARSTTRCWCSNRGTPGALEEVWCFTEKARWSRPSYPEKGICLGAYELGYSQADLGT